jgi:hypothetical protein
MDKHMQPLIDRRDAKRAVGESESKALLRRFDHEMSLSYENAIQEVQSIYARGCQRQGPVNRRLVKHLQTRFANRHLATQRHGKKEYLV